MNSTTTCYYAHSKLDYDTSREKKEIAFLEEKGFKVFNPNTDLGERGAMQPYLYAVQMNKELVVSPHMKDFIGKGCFHEVCQALASGMATWCLQDNNLREVYGIELFDDRDWKIRYAKLILAKKITV